MKAILYFLAAGLSAIGTMPYAYEFGQPLTAYSPSLGIFMSLVFAAAASFANMALGLYSLLNFSIQQKVLSTHYVLILSILSAIPLGFINFFAFRTLLPITINTVLTTAVVVTNAAIAYNAIVSAVSELKFYRRPRSLAELSIKEISFIIGVLVSLAGFVATTHGLNKIFSYLDPNLNPPLPYISAGIAFVVWIPFAALYGNSTQLCFDALFRWCQEFLINLRRLKKFEIFIFIFALLSASSYTQIFITFFNKEMLIPEFLKFSWMQFIIYKCLLPLSILSACSVNYLALRNVLKHYKNYILTNRQRI